MASAQQLRGYQGEHHGILIMPIALLSHEVVALAAICKALRGSNLQVRSPSYTLPSFWSKPMYASGFIPLAPNAGWTNLVSVSGRSQYVGIIKQFVATSVGDLATSGLEFQMLIDGQNNGQVQFSPGVEINKTGANQYPIVPRDIFLPVNETQTVVIQARNTSALQQTAVGLLAGWYFDSRDSTITSNDNAMVDGVYTPMVGATYGR